MFLPPGDKWSEEYYYGKEWNQEEKESGMIQGSLKFAKRGRRIGSPPEMPTDSAKAESV